MTWVKERAQQLGIPMEASKETGLTTTITFLGIELDSETLVTRLPPEKLKDLMDTTVELGSAVTGKMHYDAIISPTTNCSTDQIILGQANMIHSLSPLPASYYRKTK